MKLSVNLRLTITRLTTFFIMAALAFPFRVATANPIIPNYAPTNPDQLRKPSKSPYRLTVLENLEAAYNSISDVPDDRLIRIPIPSENQQEQLVIEGTVDHSTHKVVPITAAKIRNMIIRDKELIQRNRINSFTPERKQNFILLASTNLNNLAQYESCIYVDAYGSVRDGCYIDLVIRDLNSGKQWIYPRVLIDKFCVHVVKFILNETWF